MEKFDLTPPPLARPMDPSQMGGEVAALKGLLDIANNQDFELLPGQKARTSVEEYRTVAPDPIPHEQPQPVTRNGIADPKAMETALKRPVGRCILFSGSLGVGKDYVAEKIGAKIFGFSDPMYAVARYLTGVEVTSTQNKDIPGMRDLLQKLGQWGKNDVNKDYPYTPARAVFCYVVRTLGMRGAFSDDSVDWEQFGLDPNLWLKACEKRVQNFFATLDANQLSPRVAITNARFKNELEHFRALPDWDHWHVMCSPETWRERLAKKKLTPESKELRDMSEQLALALNNDVAKKLQARASNNKLRVIWNDTRPAPSPRLYTTEQFLQEIAIADAAPGIDASISDE